MSHFDTIVAEAGQAEAKASTWWGKAKGLAARLWSRVPVSVPDRVTVAAEAHGSVIGTGVKTVGLMILLLGAYHVGGSEEREAFTAYREADAQALAGAKQHEIEATAAITSESRRRQDAADARASALQSRIDAYVSDLARRPADARCTLSDADVRRLRDDHPRPRRRPAHATESAE